ncbi:MAG: DUF5050 domain-containing protein [Clostridiales bacterium]|nr:DUF5050 domain-containing protein [Clostridiales bacterium]
MRNKLRFRRSGKTERPISDIIAENGALGRGDIIYIVKKLCSLADTSVSGGESGRDIPIHPDNVLISPDGHVRLHGKTLPPTSYLPPEIEKSDPLAAGAQVYALGMLMLYMATGRESKAETDTAHLSRPLRSLIQGCTDFDPNIRFKDTKELMAAINRETGFGKKALSILMMLLTVCLAIGLSFFFGRAGFGQGGAAGEDIGFRAGYSAGFEKGFSDAPGIGIGAASFDARDGNISGNFIPEERSYAVRGETAVYFLDGENLCRMEPYTRETEVLAALNGADSLQYYGGRLYYRRGDNICRMDPKTAKEEVVCESSGGQFFIFDDIFCLYDNQSGGTGYLYGIDPDKGTLTQLNGAAEYRCLNVAEGQLYYISPDRGNSICRSDPDGGNLSLISSGSYESFCIYDGSIYAAAGDGLIRMDLNGGNPVILASRALYSPNVSEGGIFFISGQGRSLEWMSHDGRSRYTIVTGRTGSFNLAGEWIFYRNEDDDGLLWRVYISGGYSARVSE